MVSKDTVSIAFRIEDGTDGLKKLTMDAEAFHKVMQKTVGVSTKLEKNVINFAAACTGIDSASNMVNNLQSTIKNLTDAHAVQIEAETKPATVMRNTMDAREVDIQSIKKLCAAQQELGVIGDEVLIVGVAGLVNLG